MPTDFRRRCAAATCVLALSQLGQARPAAAEPTDVRSAARAHFERGIVLVKSGEIETAAEAFELAYRTSPHYSVLYNLGQAYGTLGRPVEALRALEQFLREGGERIGPARRKRVTELLALYRSRVGEVTVEIDREGASVFIDGRLVGETPLPEPVLLAKGSHALLVTKPGFTPHVTGLEVAQGESTRTSLKLEPVPVAPPPPGVLAVRCALPGASLSIDGESREVTPSEMPLLVSSGRRAVRFARPGYASDDRVLDVATGETTRVACRLTPDPVALRSQGALLRVRSAPPAAVYVDGAPYRGERLPHGPHLVRVERSGFHPWTSILSLEPRARRQVLVTLEPTREHLAELEAERQRRTALAAGIGFTGLVFAAGAGALYAWNGSRHDKWADDRDAARRELASGVVNAGTVQKWDDLTERAANIERVDGLALGLGIAGAAGLASATILWLTGDR